MEAMCKTVIDGCWLELTRLRQIVNAIYAGQRDAPDLHRVFLQMSKGNHATAVMLAMVVKWDARMRTRGDGWWYKSDSSWRDEAGLSAHESRTGRALLAKCGLVFEGRVAPDGRKTWHYKIDQSVFWKQFAEALGASVDDVSSVIAGLEKSNGRFENSERTVQNFATVRSENLNGPLQISQGTVQQISSVYQPIPTVSTSETQPDTQPSSSYARAREGTHVPEAMTTTTKDAPADMQEILQDSSSDDAAGSAAPSGVLSSSGPTAPPPSSAPPPSPAALADDALWRAYAQAMGGADVPATAFKPHVDAWQALMDMGATADEVEAVTRASLKGRNLAERPYPFWFVPDDLKRWRRTRRAARPDASRYTAGRYAGFIQTGIETAQIGLGG